jgi:membrane protease YdiL (CAAX protease family)
VSVPENPIPQPSPVTGPELYPASPSAAPVPPIEDPPWSGWDVVALVVISIVVVSICIYLTAYVAHALFLKATTWTDSLKLPEVVVAGQLLAYLFLLILMYAMVRSHSSNGVLASIRWNWPLRWTVYLAGGVALAILLVPLGNLLPMPRNAPIDDFFRTARDAYILSLFGILFAPLVEELFFRGLLYPVLESWLQAVFSAPPRVRFGRNFLLILPVWGYCLQRIPDRARFYGVVTLAIVAITFAFLKMSGRNSRIVDFLALPILYVAFWSVLAHVLDRLTLYKVSLVPIFLAVGLTALLWYRPKSSLVTVLGMTSAIVITAILFALIHASQLKYSWGPVLIIFLVGIVLTTVRAVKKSLSATVLMHMAYNGTIFITGYIATDGFRHMEKFNQ